MILHCPNNQAPLEQNHVVGSIVSVCDFSLNAQDEVARKLLLYRHPNLTLEVILQADNLAINSRPLEWLSCLIYLETVDLIASGRTNDGKIQGQTRFIR